MEFFKTNTKIPFMRQRKWAFLFSAIIFIFSIISIAIHGLNLGLDFTGGTEVEVTFAQPVDTNQIRQNLAAQGFSEAVVQVYDVKDISVRVSPHKELTQEQLKQKLIAAMPGGQIGQLSYIGPQVGKSLMTNGILAVIVALIGTMIYIALRFEFRFAISAAVALIHDPVLILGIFSFFHLEFNLIVLAGVLTVIGIRRAGAAALDLAYVAAARLDGFWEAGLNTWDIAAGTLLITEAGGLVGDFKGEGHYLNNGNIVTGNPKIYQELLEVVRKNFS